jgi:DNA (cytosine-5)-methyltransferase 1
MIIEKEKVKFIDLFAGMGGIRLGFEQAFKEAGYEPVCVLTSEIKNSAIRVLNKNFNHGSLVGDITKVRTEDIPDFDYLLGGFPCQAFSVAGKQRGFMDTRGTLFFEIERIIREKQPKGFLLENVEGLVTHDRQNKEDKIGRTLITIIASLEELGYIVTWKVLNSKDFGIAQNRNRIYIVGAKKDRISLDDFPKTYKVFSDIMEQGMPTINNCFTEKLFAKYNPTDLYGKAIKDKRGGENNIHSWDLELRGKVSDKEKELLNLLLKERRKKGWASIIGIDWMDGMPLTKEQVSTFYKEEHLQNMLDNLVEKGYLVYEYPKKRVEVLSEVGGHVSYERVYDESKPKGYNIVTGKLSFDFSRIIDPTAIVPTLVAMDMSTIGVVDGCGLRHLTLREGLRLFGYPENYSLNVLGTDKNSFDLGFDLLGNTVCVPVIERISQRLAIYHKNQRGK